GTGTGCLNVRIHVCIEEESRSDCCCISFPGTTSLGIEPPTTSISILKVARCKSNLRPLHVPFCQLKKYLICATPHHTTHKTTMFGTVRTTCVARRVPQLALRTKRTKTANDLDPGARKLVNQMSAMSPKRMAPKKLELSQEDLIRHRIVQVAWREERLAEKLAREQQHRQQYEMLQDTCEELRKVDGFLFNAAVLRVKGNKFPIEMRVPTETPPNKIWQSEWKAEVKK
ncbi:mitochondrial ribosomal protein L28-domain-containing protein, partial [Yarrowia lipolytica]